MPRPSTKDQVLSESRKEHLELEELLSTLSPAQMTEPGVAGHWSIKDTLSHLTEWEQMVLGWEAASRSGKTPAIPAEGFKWSQLPALNQQIYEQHRQRPLPEVLEMFRASYQQVTALIAGLTEKELFTPGLFPWMNKNTLAAYFVSCTSSHYRWATKEIKKSLKKGASQ